eukprot:TRINITY_DN29420_c0_g1_i1.p1 TRINITY_DN29420_c0_g1~~TRINITY_DN29420_c0_g1_i1.p1  ORF type:complete len:1853 (+),score=313.62 TRINITY_DN29420_c0_g1_i1:82-5640(+)
MATKTDRSHGDLLRESVEFSNSGPSEPELIDKTMTMMSHDVKNIEQIRAMIPNRQGVHARAPLPATHGNIHPACVLLRQRALSCSEVCSGRHVLVQKMFEKVTDLDDHLRAAIEGGDKDNSGDFGVWETQCLLEENADKFFGEEVPLSQRSVLVHFIELKADMTVGVHKEVFEKVRFILMLWNVYKYFRTRWDRELANVTGPRDVLKVMRGMNNGKKVSLAEARWVFDKVESLECRSEEEETFALKLCMAYWYMSDEEELGKDKLLRERLIQRLRLEQQFGVGGLRLLNMMMIFLLILTGMSLFSAWGGTYRTDQRGIKENLQSKLDLESFESVTSLEGVYDYTKQFSRLSAVLSPLSHNYFSSQSRTLLDEQRTFTKEPDRLPSLDLVFTGTFTLQAWIRISRAEEAAGSIPILRKALGSLGGQERLSCWSWNFPPSISFGAHDYGKRVPNPATGLAEEFVAAPYPIPNASHGGEPHYRERDDMVLHTLSVNRTHVTFLVDGGQVLSTIQLHRPITDCISRDLALGAKGITLAAVRYYPWQLSALEVQEIFHGGSRLMLPPLHSEPVSKEDLLLRQGQEQKDYTAFAIGDLSDHTRYSTRIAASEILNPLLEPVSLRSPNHPITPKHSDPTLGYKYWQIYDLPVYTDASSKNMAPGSALPPGSAQGFTVSTWLRFDTNVGHGYHIARAVPLFDQAWQPVWNGWDNFCWMVYAGADYTAIYTKSSSLDANGKQSDGPLLQVLDKQAPEGWWFKGKSYRHIVYQIDPAGSMPLRICIDGVCTGTPQMDKYTQLCERGGSGTCKRLSELGSGAPLDLAKPAMDCSETGLMQSYPSEQYEKALNSSRVYLNRRPNDDYPMTTWQMSTKYFDRVLTPDEVKELFENDPDPEDKHNGSIRQNRGCRQPSEIIDDRTFRDGFGHDCLWYFRSRSKDASVCSRTPAAAKSCPVACQSSEMCWGPESSISNTTLQIWNMQMEFRARGDQHSSTTCVGKSTTPEKEAIVCAKNAPNWPSQCQKAGLDTCGPKDCSMFEGNRPALLECLGNTSWVPEDGARFDAFLPCRDIITRHDPDCDWDDSLLDDWASSVNASNSWSINFWLESVSEEECLLPMVRLLNGDGGTFTMLGGTQRLVPDGNSICNKEEWFGVSVVEGQSDGLGVLHSVADVQAPKSVQGTKHFLLFGRRPDGFTGIHFDTLSSYENLQDKSVVRPGKQFLRVINIIGNVRMSPWELRSDFPGPETIANMQYSQAPLEAMKRGPAQPLYQQRAIELERDVEEFTESSLLMAPPLILQTRESNNRCDVLKARATLNLFMERSKNFQCSAPFTCQDDVSVSQACDKDDEDILEHFGTKPDILEGEEFYVEYLATIAENQLFSRMVLNRSTMTGVQTVMETDRFLDSLTRDGYILALFYTPDINMISRLRVFFETSEGRVRMQGEVKHLPAASGNPVRGFTAIMICSMILIAVWLVLGIVSLRKKFKWNRELLALRPEEVATRWNSCVEGFLQNGVQILQDVLFPILLLALLIQMLLDERSSAENVDSILTQLVGLNWDAGSSVIEGYWLAKKRAYLDLVEVIDDRIASAHTLHQIALVAMILLLLSVITATSAHPRTALITKTLAIAANDFLHFGTLAAAVFFGFALMGSVWFGSEKEEMALLGSTASVLFDALLGPPDKLEMGNPEDPPAFDYQLFILLWHFIGFFIILNFVLTIIIHAYESVNEEIENNETEQDIFHDAWEMCLKFLRSKRFRWPSDAKLLDHLEKTLKSKYVSKEQLLWDREYLFGDDPQVDSFMNYYRRFSFCTGDDDMMLNKPVLEDVATFQCLTLQKLEQLGRVLKAGQQSSEKLLHTLNESQTAMAL